MTKDRRKVRGSHVVAGGSLALVFIGGLFATKATLGNLSFERKTASSTEMIAAPETVDAIVVDTASTTATREVTQDEPVPADLPPIVGSAGHMSTPSIVRGLYMSQCMAGAPGLRQSLIDFVESGKLNAIVIDIKDFSGGIAFPTDDPLLAQNVSHECGANDMRELVASLHAKGIYVIGRITVFQDPTYTKEHPSQAVQDVHGGLWKNDGGLSFVDVGAKPFWDYIVRLSQVSYREMGFDELNFDYIRFPSDGPLKDAVYTYDKEKTKTEALKEFYKYLQERLQPSGSSPGKDAPVISADMFGMVSSHEDDLGIGQVLESAMPYFDYIDPMMYPSHYPKGFDGYGDVNAHSSDIVYSESKAVKARAIAAGFTGDKIRPWLQSFDYPVPYTPARVKGEIDAEQKTGLQSYLFWDAANKYVSLRQVLQ